MNILNLNKLKGKIVENEMNVSDIAKLLEIDRSTLYRKLKGDGDKLTVKEANQIVNVLHLSKEEAMAIFFKDTVA